MRVGRTPWVVLGIISANLVVAFSLLLYPSGLQEWAFYPDKPQFAGAFSSLFVHQNTLHLLGNLVFLAAVGPSVEFSLGRVKFVALYLFGGLAGVVMHTLLMAGGTVSAPLVGASGAVAACVGYASVRYAGIRVPLAPRVASPIWVLVLVWTLLQGMGALVRIGFDSGGTAYWAHLGGLLFGLVASVLLRAPKAAELQFGHEVLDAMNLRGPAAALAAAQKHLEKHPGDPKALASTAEAARQLGDEAQERDALIQMLQAADGPKQEAAERLATLGALEAIPSVKRSAWAFAWQEEAPSAAAILLKSVVDGPDEDAQKPDALAALATLLRDSDPGAARDYAEILATRFSMHPAADLVKARGLLN